MKKGILFDMDGTLWDAVATNTRAWQAVLDEFGCDVTLTEAQMRSYMGLPMDEIFRRIFPEGMDPSRAVQLQNACQTRANATLAKEGGTLYPHLEETLRACKEAGYHLYIVTNAQDGYVEAFFDSCGLSDYFDDYEMFGRTGKFKAENITLVCERNHLDRAVYVGDTQGDFDASTEAGVPFIFATYGMGDAPSSTYRIASIAQLPSCLENSDLF